MTQSKPGKNNPATLWEIVRAEARQQQAKEPLLQDFFQDTVLRHASLEDAIGFILAHKLQDHMVANAEWQPLFARVLSAESALAQCFVADMEAIRSRDCACNYYYQALCFFKGFHALAAYRIMHALWLQNHQPLALLLQNRISAVWGVDIHPAARIGDGVMLDHATGIVIGETAVIGHNVSIMQSVTLGGTGKESGDRHPKIRDGVLISVGATILGNIEIGEGAQVAAGSVVLEPVPAHTLVAGVPAKIVGKPCNKQPALIMDHQI